MSAAAQEAGIEFEIRETDAPGAARRLAKEAARQGASVVAAAGGDGTISEVADGIADTGAALGILPLGTGNDFVRTVGISRNLPDAVNTLVHGVERPIDVGLANGRRFINIAGCGFDAVVAERVNAGYKRLHGTSAYLAALIQGLAGFRPTPMAVTVDGETIELRAMLCSIGNAQYYGGGMRITPDARLDDGLLDVCLLGEVSIPRFLLAFPRVFKGTHVTHPAVTMLRGRKIRVEASPSMPVFVDGDLLGRTPVEFEVLPGALRLVAPA